MTKRAMISQPMAGKTDEEIAEARDRAHAKLREMGYEFVNTLSAGPMCGRDLPTSSTARARISSVLGELVSGA